MTSVEQRKDYDAANCDCETCYAGAVAKKVASARTPLEKIKALLDSQRFQVCPTCGNKRCPHATHHKNECTNSNAVGQPGSSYEHVSWGPMV